MRTLDIDECAKFLNINCTTASEMAASGVLPGAKIGRAWVFLEDDLSEYLRNEVRKQQQERRDKAKLPEPALKAKIDLSKVDIISTFSAVQRRQRGRRNIPPQLDKSSDETTE